jgi:uncharacterized membrane protein
MGLLSTRPVRRRRHRELFALSAVLFMLGAFVIEGGVRGLVLFASLIVFYLAIMHRLSGEDVGNAERGNFIGFGG